MTDLLNLLLVNCLWLLAGIGVTTAAGAWRAGGKLGSLGLSYLAGVAVYGVVGQLLLVLGLSLGRVEIAAVCLLLAAGVLVRRDRVRPRLPRPGVVGAAVLVVLVVLAVDLWFEPLWAYDAWTFWTPKAHALAALGGLDARWFTQPALANRDYPILFPALEAAGFRFTGYETRLLDLQSLLFLCGVLLVFAEVVCPRAPSWARFVPLLVVLAPSVADQLASAEADVPLAAFYACAAATAFLWWRERDPAALALFGVFAAAAAATKAEGLPFVLALGVSFGGVALRRDARAAAALAGVTLAAVVAGVLPWRLWVDHHGIPEQASVTRALDPSALARRAERGAIASRYLTERLFDPRAWLVLVPLLLWLTVLAWRRGRREASAAVGATVLLCLVALVDAYWTSQFEIHYHLATSARRVITGPVFAWALLVPLLWSDAGAP